ncbi:MAG: hypothetical protein ACT4OP_06970 [Actinomycetota bacterium]
MSRPIFLSVWLVVAVACAIPATTGSGGGQKQIAGDEPETPPPTSAAAPSTPASPTTAVGSERQAREVPEDTVPTTSPEGVPVVISGVPSEFVEAVMADAVRVASLERGALQVLRAEPVEWSDGSLGCPQPGMFCTQAIIPGFWIEIDANGQVLDYRLDSSGGFRLCEQPS